MMLWIANRITIFFFIITFSITSYALNEDPLPSWNEGAIKHNIIEFVQLTTNPSSKDFVVEKDRIATIDNDGTLWVEQPVYTQVLFMLDRYKSMGKKLNKQLTQKDFEKIFVVTSTGISVDEYHTCAKEWLASAMSPHFKRPYTQLVYQPMLEVIRYLQKNNFKVYIVSGGGQDFVRAFAEKTYGISPEFVIGSTDKTQYLNKNGKPILLKIAKPLFISDKTGKPEAIDLFIGKKPIIAFGNSDGDKEMLEWTQSGNGKRLMLLVHHDDAVREYAYGPQSKVGTFSDALMDEAKKQNWNVISMKKDWKVIFP